MRADRPGAQRRCAGAAAPRECRYNDTGFHLARKIKIKSQLAGRSPARRCA